jgi:O-antigen ligase
MLLVPVTVAFGSLVTLHVGEMQATPTDALVAAIALVAGYDIRRAQTTFFPLVAARSYRWLIGSLLALVALMALSVLWATDRVAALKEVVKWSEALVVALVAPRYLTTRRTILLLLGTMVLVGLAEALLGIAQGTVLASTQHVSADRGVRVVGTFGQPNPYAGYLNLTLPFVLALAAWAEPRRWRWWSVGAAIILGVALAMAQSRGATLGLAAALLAMAWVGWPVTRRYAVGAALGGVACLGFILVTGRITLGGVLARLGWRPLTDSALGAQVTNANFSTLERLAHWAAAVRMVAAHPLLGVGIGNYPIVYAHYAVPHWPLALGHAHNLYLNMAAELGVGGAVLFLFFVGIGLWATWSRSAAPPAAAIGIWGVGVALIVHNLFDDLTTHSMLIQWIVILICAQMLPFVRLDEGERTAQESD